MTPVQENLTPDPINSKYAIDKDGRLYKRTTVRRDTGDLVDIGYALLPQERS